MIERTQRVEVQLRFEASPEVVFPFLTRRRALHQVAGCARGTRPEAGWRLSSVDGRRRRGEWRLRGSRSHPGCVVFTWGWEGDAEVPPGSTTVRIELEANGDATTLTLEHSGLPTDRAVEMHEEGWHIFGARLIVVAAGGDPGRCPPRPAMREAG